MVDARASEGVVVARADVGRGLKAVPDTPHACRHTPARGGTEGQGRDSERTVPLPHLPWLPLSPAQEQSFGGGGCGGVGGEEGGGASTSGGFDGLTRKEFRMGEKWDETMAQQPVMKGKKRKADVGKKKDMATKKGEERERESERGAPKVEARQVADPNAHVCREAVQSTQETQRKKRASTA